MFILYIVTCRQIRYESVNIRENTQQDRTHDETHETVYITLNLWVDQWDRIDQ